MLDLHNKTEHEMFFSFAFRGGATVFLGSAGPEVEVVVVEGEDVVGGHASRPWPRALMRSW